MKAKTEVLQSSEGVISGDVLSSSSKRVAGTGAIEREMINLHEQRRAGLRLRRPNRGGVCAKRKDDHKYHLTLHSISLDICTDVDILLESNSRNTEHRF